MSDDDCGAEALAQPRSATADPAAFASSKKARQLELRRLRNRRAQSKFRSLRKAFSVLLAASLAIYLYVEK